ncbi:MAG: hypothetical protein PWP47_1499 [Synergistaceae bacterium]|nr:hypothetical protein [Synergistaceae bacterium]
MEVKEYLYALDTLADWKIGYSTPKLHMGDHRHGGGVALFEFSRELFGETAVMKPDTLENPVYAPQDRVCPVLLWH